MGPQKIYFTEMISVKYIVLDIHFSAALELVLESRRFHRYANKYNWSTGLPDKISPVRNSDYLHRLKTYLFDPTELSQISQLSLIHFSRSNL